MRPVMRATISRLTTPIFAIACAILTNVGCGKSSVESTGSSTHVLEATVVVSVLAVYGPALQEAEVLIDGQRVAHQVFSPSVGFATFDVKTTYSTGGSHRVAFRVMRQQVPAIFGTDTDVAYIVGGSLGGKAVSLKPGDSVYWDVEVP
jgi:hypothetical protein